MAILTVMNRRTLRAAMDGLGLDGVDRRNLGDMVALVSRSRRAQPALLLEYLNEAQVKAVCENIGLSAVGRRKTLIQRLVRFESREGNATSSTRKRATTKRQTRKVAMADSTTTEETTVERENPRPIRLPDPPAGMIRVTRTELVWPGKYRDDGTREEVPRVSLPFQVIETINESRARREAKKANQPTLFDVWEGDEGETFEKGWRNKLIWGDNLLIMGSLLEKFAGKVDLIYIDPPFATGVDFSFTAQIGDSGEEVFKEQSAIEEKAYRDTWGAGMGSYLQMMSERLILMRSLLAEGGSIYLHCDWRVNWALRAVMNEIFGTDYFRNEIIWHYENKLGTGWGAKTFDTRHDVLLKFSKGKKYAHNEITEKVKVQKMQPVTKKIEGERVWLKNEDGSLMYAEGASERSVGDVWTLPIVPDTWLATNPEARRRWSR